MLQPNTILILHPNVAYAAAFTPNCYLSGQIQKVYQRCCIGTVEGLLPRVVPPSAPPEWWCRMLVEMLFAEFFMRYNKHHWLHEAQQFLLDCPRYEYWRFPWDTCVEHRLLCYDKPTWSGISTLFYTPL